MMTTLLLSLLFSSAMANSGVREVSANSCDIIRLNLGLGMTTQVVFEQEPIVTLHADQKHFKINTNALSPRSLAIIPFVEASELNVFRNSKGHLLLNEALIAGLDASFKTNLFVFFKNNNQLMFQLRFVEKSKADYIVKIKQTFEKGCVL